MQAQREIPAISVNYGQKCPVMAVNHKLAGRCKTRLLTVDTVLITK